MALSDETCASIEKTVERFRKVGTPSTRKDYLVIIGSLISVSNEAIEEFMRQGRVHGVDWLVRIADALLSEVARGNTYRDGQGVLRLNDTPKAGALKKILEA